MLNAAEKFIAKWPKWKRELAGFSERQNIKKSLSEHIIEQFKAAMKNKNINQTELAIKMGATPANVSRFLSTNENLTLKTLDRIATAIGGEIEIKFIPGKTELELLREENERLKKMLGAKRYVENGTLNKK